MSEEVADRLQGGDGPGPGSTGAWLLAARPRTLPASIAPVLLGTALAASEGRARGGLALVAVATALCLQLGANLANDVFDFQRGADGPGRLGPPRAAASGLLTPRQLRIGTAVAFAAAASLGSALVAAGGWPFALLGAGCIAAGLAYTAGPWPLAYHGLGDLAVFLFFGPVATAGSYAVQAGALPATVLLASLPSALLATAILAVNNLRDLESDARAGKRTLAVRLGLRGARVHGVALLVLPYTAIAAFVAASVLPPASLLCFATAPLACGVARTLRTCRDGASLNAALARTAALHATFTLALAAGVLL